ncbi:MAG: Flp family type IVb pilin [Alphaproteobacteria bacterium]|jgi:pilus assembly protein Flp/PilA|nr:Flp family type IVb pilin [Alphaproteobacteria bacterium]HJP20444.1 Flp family type IVb pilin [Alphaproteobacteria bacterium]
MNAPDFILKRLWRHVGGVTAVEYGLIAGLIAVAIIAVVTTLGSDLTNIFNDVSDGLKNGS